MTTDANPKDTARSTSAKETGSLGNLLFSISMLVITGMAFGELYKARFGGPVADPYWEDMTPAPLVMQGGDPYIRALMRTISASESNDERPYSLLYGGQHFDNFAQHPDICVPIVVGPNTGDCTTAAGRYQFLTTTWESKAQEYHPSGSRFVFWDGYSFTPEHQDKVVYAWLNDPNAWGVDLSYLLRNGEVDRVLRLLSPTWTSLGYGIETNSMSAVLPQIYDQMLQEELSQQSSGFFAP